MQQNPHSWPEWAMEQIVIEEYDPIWPIIAVELIEELKALYDFESNFEHIGSTAVLNLMAKPIIDLLLPVNDFRDLVTIVNSLNMGNWNLIPPELDKGEKRRTFVKVVNNKRFAHLHLITDSVEIEHHIKFRDILRENHYVANKYRELKLGLACEFRQDREAYTSAKSYFIESVLNKQ